MWQNKQPLIYPIKKGDSFIRFYRHDSDLFSILCEAYLAIEHDRRERILKELDTKYKNLTGIDAELYISLCKPCQKKQNGSKNNVVAYDFIKVQFPFLISSCQVDLIDFQSEVVGTYINTT